MNSCVVPTLGHPLLHIQQKANCKNVHLKMRAGSCIGIPLPLDLAKQVLESHLVRRGNYPYITHIKLPDSMAQMHNQHQYHKKYSFSFNISNVYPFQKSSDDDFPLIYCYLFNSLYKINQSLNHYLFWYCIYIIT